MTSGWQLDLQDVNASTFSTFYTSHCNKYPQHCSLPSDYTTTALDISNNESGVENEPNTALLSTILMFGTFMIAYGLKQFRNSHYFGRTVKTNLNYNIWSLTNLKKLLLFTVSLLHYFFFTLASTSSWRFWSPDRHHFHGVGRLLSWRYLHKETNCAFWFAGKNKSC